MVFLPQLTLKSELFHKSEEQQRAKYSISLGILGTTHPGKATFVFLYDTVDA